MDERQQTIDAVFGALTRNELTLADLTARQLGALVGRTTGHLYHHFGSLEGLLFEVAQAGYQLLGVRMLEPLKAHLLEDAAEQFVVFGLSHPTLYALMFEYRFDWAALRARGQCTTAMPGKRLFDAFAAYLAVKNVEDPAQITRVILGGLHGMVSLALSGRANVGALERTDGEVARAAARKLIQLAVPASQELKHGTRRSSSVATRPRASKPVRKGRADGTLGQPKRRS